MNIAARTASWLPYDAEVEYLESSGTQYIDSGVSLNTLDFEVIVSGTNTFWGYVHQNVVGGTWIGLYPWTFRCHFKNYYYQINIASYLNSDHVFDFKSEKGLLIDDVKTASFSTSLGTDSITTQPLIFFGDYDFSLNTVECRTSKYKSICVVKNGGVVRDMISVRFTNENGEREGAMYDRVSKSLIRNAGTGAFIAGPDVSAANRGGYKRKCVRRSYRRSSRPSARFWRTPLVWEVAA